jgi:riboflavin synthase
MAAGVFTGLVEDVGRLRARTPRGPGARLRVDTALGPLALGESIAVMGVCLTVDAVAEGGFEADASRETLGRTTLGSLAIGAAVHLERAMPLGGRLGGHLVSGHVDGLSRLLERRPVGQSVQLAFELEPALARFVAPKGSVALDGVSLTVNEVREGRFTVMIVPHTREATVLGRAAAGMVSNLEVDILARYVARWLETRGGARGPDRGEAEGRPGGGGESLASKLSEAGFL